MIICPHRRESVRSLREILIHASPLKRGLRIFTRGLPNPSALLPLWTVITRVPPFSFDNGVVAKGSKGFPVIIRLLAVYFSYTTNGWSSYPKKKKRHKCFPPSHKEARRFSARYLILQAVSLPCPELFASRSRSYQTVPRLMLSFCQSKFL